MWEQVQEALNLSAARVLTEEHRIYPEAIAEVVAGGWSIEGRRFVRQGRVGSPSGQ